MAKKRMRKKITDFVELRTVIYTAMAINNLRWHDVTERMSKPMAVATLMKKCNNPSKMTLAELIDITEAVGIDRNEARLAI